MKKKAIHFTDAEVRAIGVMCSASIPAAVYLEVIGVMHKIRRYF